MKLLDEESRIYHELRPLIRGYVHTYHYSELKEFSEEHKEDLYNHMLGSDHFNRQLFNELICADEYHAGIIAGYIKPEDAKADLMERIDDVVYEPLNKWVQKEYYSETHAACQRSDEEQIWDNEMASVARDINSRMGY